MNILFAATEAAGHGGEAAGGGLLTSLGIDWKLFVAQTLAFAILLFILGRFVYPVLIRSIDERRARIEAGLKEAKESQEALAKAEARVEKLLAEARKEADEIIARGHAESAAAIAEAETKAKQRAERIVADAKSQLDAEVSKARAALKKDTIQLVALATEKVIGQKLDGDSDVKLVETAIAGSDARKQGVHA